MINDIGIKLKGEDKKCPAYLTGLLAMILVATYVFSLKNYEPVNNIIITGGIMVYPLTFLIISLICKFYGFKEARKSIFISSALYFSFILLIMIGVAPKANVTTTGYNAVIQYLFVNNFIDITNNLTIFYPTLGQFFGVLIAYLVSHLLYATIYNAVNKYTIDYLAVGLSLFIAYIADKLLFIPILLIKGLTTGANTFDYLIQCLTSEFISAIAIVVILVIIYATIIVIKKSVKK